MPIKVYHWIHIKSSSCPRMQHFRKWIENTSYFSCLLKIFYNLSNTLYTGWKIHVRKHFGRCKTQKNWFIEATACRAVRHVVCCKYFPLLPITLQNSSTPEPLSKFMSDHNLFELITLQNRSSSESLLCLLRGIWVCCKPFTYSYHTTKQLHSRTFARNYGRSRPVYHKLVMTLHNFRRFLQCAMQKQNTIFGIWPTALTYNPPSQCQGRPPCQKSRS